MKKFTALALVVLMLVMSVPFVAFAAPKWTEVKTAEDFAKMTDGNYWLTADIDLSKATWTTIPEFSGTLNGNGHTVTVPKDATMIDKLSGTVKNLNLKGAMTLDSADASKYLPIGDVKGGGIGALANYGWGATVDNVDVDVDITYNGGIANFGGIVGNAMCEWSITDNVLTLGENTNITNCTIAGDWNITYDNQYKSAIGGIVGCAFGKTAINTCAVYVKANVVNSKGQNGGFVGSAYTDQYRNADNSNPSNYTEVVGPTLVANCLYAGEFNFTKTNNDYSNVDQTAAMVGYARGVTITSCFATGKWYANGSAKPIFSYCNTGYSVWCDVTILGCASVADCKKNGATETVAINGKTTGIFAMHNLLMTGQTISINGKGDLNDTLDPHQSTGNKVVGDAAAVTAEFVRINAEKFKSNNGVVELVMPTFTPEADPDFNAQGGNDNVQTGDMTMILVVVSVVSLAAVTVIAKKKVTE